VSTSSSHVDVASTIVIVVTFVLFAIAVFEKGLTHDLLLEAGVFLVSVKLILMNAKSNAAAATADARLRAIEAALARIEALNTPARH
jgi:hypothetical protein